MEKEKNKKMTLQKWHIVLLIVGIIFLFIPAFHEDIWFDESYSVAIAKHSFADIWTITGNDVHPALYYWMLHIIYLIFGNSVIAYRLFSVVAIAILGILGYTHIRKDFGDKVGFWFSFFAFFLPVMNTYAAEIRMYSWSCLFVTLVAIYAYRLYKNVEENADKKFKIKNLILFGIFSIACCFIHYYALVTTGVINVMLLIYFILHRKEDKTMLRNFILLAVLQVLLYIPWLMYLIGQIIHVGRGFWITLDLSTLVQVLSFQFVRQLDSQFAFNAPTVIALVASILMYVYIAYRIIKAKKQKLEMKPGILSLGLYLGIIGIMLCISLIRPILFARYLLVLTGLYIFTFAYFIAQEEKKWLKIIVVTLICILAIASNVQNILINYDSSNMKQIEYLEENLQEGDIILYSNIGNGGVIAAFFPEYKQYFYNGAYWDVEEAYKAYGPGMETIYNYEDVLRDYHGRIWLIDSENMGMYNDEFPKKDTRIVEGPIRFDTKYQNYIYNILLLEKE